MKTVKITRETRAYDRGDVMAYLEDGGPCPECGRSDSSFVDADRVEYDGSPGRASIVTTGKCACGYCAEMHAAESADAYAVPEVSALYQYVETEVRG